MKNLRAICTSKARKKVRARPVIAAKKLLVGGGVWVVTSSIACGKSTAIRLLKDAAGAAEQVRAVSADAASAAVLRAKWRKVLRRVLAGQKPVALQAACKQRGRLSAADFAALKRALRAAIFGGGAGMGAGGNTGTGGSTDAGMGAGGSWLYINRLRARARKQAATSTAATGANDAMATTGTANGAAMAAAAKKELEKLLHFRIKKRLLKAVAQGAELIEIPLYFESKNYKHFINKLVIFADESTQIKRLCVRDGCSKTAARALLAAQISAAKKAKWANFVIENNGDLAELAAACERFLKEKF